MSLVFSHPMTQWYKAYGNLVECMIPIQFNGEIEQLCYQYDYVEISWKMGLVAKNEHFIYRQINKQ